MSMPLSSRWCGEEARVGRVGRVGRYSPAIGSFLDVVRMADCEPWPSASLLGRCVHHSSQNDGGDRNRRASGCSKRHAGRCCLRQTTHWAKAHSPAWQRGSEWQRFAGLYRPTRPTRASSPHHLDENGMDIAGGWLNRASNPKSDRL
jgi:hypothetical protein